MQKRDSISLLNLHITDHCNLNCRGCDNFSPLSPPVFIDINTLEQDCKRMATLSKEKIETIHLSGGEPLLHPEINNCMKIVREIFPKTNIELLTNGLLLPTRTDDFWIACKENDVKIIVTRYPIKIDHKKIQQLAQSWQVKFDFYGSSESVEKNMRCVPLDVDGKQNFRDSFLRCDRANRCVTLDNGKIYTCTLIPYIKYFNAHFQKELTVSDADYKDIYKAKSLDEILDFLRQPIPFCRFCNQKNIIQDIGYGVSKKEISEWIG